MPKLANSLFRRASIQCCFIKIIDKDGERLYGWHKTIDDASEPPAVELLPAVEVQS